MSQPQFTMGQLMDSLMNMQQGPTNASAAPAAAEPRRITLEDQQRERNEVTIREVQHPVPTEVHVIQEVPREVVREVIKEVIREVPIEVPVEVIKEVPVEARRLRGRTPCNPRGAPSQDALRPAARSALAVNARGRTTGAWRVPIAPRD